MIIDSAFPTGFITDDKGKIVGGSTGMTLRDYFAAKAMQGICARVHWSHSGTAETAYEIADAMLKARDGNS